MIAVITADLINSSSYTPEIMELVMTNLKKEFKELEKQYQSNFITFRGDSFQGAIPEIQAALKVSMLLKCCVLKANVSENTGKPVADVRISIGIGAFQVLESRVAEPSGEAYYFSGKVLDSMKSHEKTLSVKTAFESINSEFDVSLKLLESILNRWSAASAEVVYYLLKGYKEREIATIIGRSQAAVNLRKKAANWVELSLLLKRFETVIARAYFDVKK